MNIPGNILYFFKQKHNWQIPDIFNEFLLNNSYAFYSAETVNDYFEDLLENNNEIKIEGFGAGSKKYNAKFQKIVTIAKNSSTNFKFGITYQKLLNFFNIKSVLEFGTNLGVGTMFLALASNSVKVTTIEGDRNLYDFTKNKFNKLNISNVEFINYDFDEAIKDFNLKNKIFDMFFVDGNHKSEAILRYVSFIERNLVNGKFILIIDDINWSIEMNRAWKKIVSTHKNCFILNLFRTGIIFSGYDFPVNKEFFVKFID
ncbi:MAG: class I SAM-dependent methyltransferase [Bacteroidales bacterium]|jgi:predicted O-methyltransferase YrrM|nr:class I SAM-dependent methyltransferase [Bacteroidales bacterium]